MASNEACHKFFPLDLYQFQQRKPPYEIGGIQRYSRGPMQLYGSPIMASNNTDVVIQEWAKGLRKSFLCGIHIKENTAGSIGCHLIKNVLPLEALCGLNKQYAIYCTQYCAQSHGQGRLY